MSMRSRLGRYGIYSEDEYSGWPEIVFDDDSTDAHRAFDIAYEFAQHVADGAIVVWVEAGVEELRYITGKAIAFKAAVDGPGHITITLDEIGHFALEDRADMGVHDLSGAELIPSREVWS
jgi:hypothetical protein